MHMEKKNRQERHRHAGSGTAPWQVDLTVMEFDAKAPSTGNGDALCGRGHCMMLYGM